MSDNDSAEIRAEMAGRLRAKGYEYRETPFTLTSGALSHDYIDGKYCVANGADLAYVSSLAGRLLGETPDAVGGLTMGADALAHGIAIHFGCDWFSVRKAQKDHGRQARVEGTRLVGAPRVLLVDDVVSTGASTLTALDAVLEACPEAQIVGAIALCDRGDGAPRRMAERGVRWLPLCTYKELGIDPIVEPIESRS